MAERIPGPTARRLKNGVGILPFIGLVLAWYLLTTHGNVPAYQLPTIGKVVSDFVRKVDSGVLLINIAASVQRLVLAFLIGNALAIPLGFAIALNRHVSDLLRPLLTFMQSIAGIAWVPLAIIWLGVGNGPVLFVMVNTIFFSSIYNVVSGAESIPRAQRRAVQSLGANTRQLYTAVVLPGALVHILLGLRLSMAYGFRAMVGSELVAGTNGIGYMIIKASNAFAPETVILGMLVVAAMWFLLDRFVFTPIERRTVVRWGMLAG